MLATPTPSRLALAVALAALSTTPLAAADRASGTCVQDDRTIEVKDGVFYRAPDPFDESVQRTVVVLTTIPLDKVAIARAADKEDAIREQVWAADGAAKIELEIDAEATVTGMHVQHGGGSSSMSGTSIGTLAPSVNDGKRIAAKFTRDDAMKCALDFDLSSDALAAAERAAPPAPVGKPLPAGGGEPGKVFMRNLAASQKGDIDAMIATASSAQAEEMRKSKDDPDFPQMIELMKAFVPKSAKVLGGRDFGDRAELDVEGTDADGGPTTGLIRMVKEADGWKVEKSSFKSKG